MIKLDHKYWPFHSRVAYTSFATGSNIIKAIIRIPIFRLIFIIITLSLSATATGTHNTQNNHNILRLISKSESSLSSKSYRNTEKQFRSLKKTAHRFEFHPQKPEN